MATIKVFDYIEELDAFLVTEEFTRLSNYLGLTEWHPAVWIGRLFCMDNDVGEHWFDNWSEREELKQKAKALGIDSFDLMIVVPERFKDGRDGPCHTVELRKTFWTDVLKSLHLSHDLLFTEARYNNVRDKELQEQGYPLEEGDYIEDLEQRIEAVQAEAYSTQSRPNV